MTSPTLEFFAVIDPSDRERMSYWRLSSRGLISWPPAATYGPEDASMTARCAWLSRVFTAITDSPIAAAARFSVHKVRCLCCSRPLRDPMSTTYGIGPECRAGFPIDVLAALAEEVGRLHASLNTDWAPTFDLFVTQPEGARS